MAGDVPSSDVYRRCGSPGSFPRGPQRWPPSSASGRHQRSHQQQIRGPPDQRFDHDRYQRFSSGTDEGASRVRCDVWPRQGISGLGPYALTVAEAELVLQMLPSCEHVEQHLGSSSRFMRDCLTPSRHGFAQLRSLKHTQVGDQKDAARCIQHGILEQTCARCYPSLGDTIRREVR